ncbi:MAG: DUF3048 domain-containing protein [Acidimicrobiales bacterium]
MRFRGAALVLAGLSVLAGCSGGGDEPAAGPRRGGAGGEAAVSSTTAAPPVLAPLTGLSSPNAGRPALVVKVDNSPAARPQVGLDKADVVFEEVVEGGEVRFMAVYQSQDAESVGPVRSVRPVDPDIVSPLGGLFAYSGGAPQFTALIRRAPVTLVGFDELSRAYTRRRDRRAPSNLFTSTAALYAGAKADDTAPPPLFGFVGTGVAFAPSGAVPAVHLTVNVSARSRADWDFDAATQLWRRGTNGTAHTVEGGAQLAFANVVVQFVPYRNTSSRDPAGSPVPTAEVVGTGPVLVASAGQTVRGTWSKSSPTAVTEYRDGAGAPLALTPGTTWVTLAPTGAATSAA